MKTENFTTMRCSKCNWIKQFAPGKEYSSEDFKCNCAEEITPKTRGQNGKSSRSSKADKQS